MRRLFIIILDPNVDASILRSRISELGDYYIIYNNQYLVLADFENAQALYEQLVRNETNTVRIVILGISPDALTYWGYSDKGLWSWLTSHGM